MAWRENGEGAEEVNEEKEERTTRDRKGDQSERGRTRGGRSRTHFANSLARCFSGLHFANRPGTTAFKVPGARPAGKRDFQRVTRDEGQLAEIEAADILVFPPRFSPLSIFLPVPLADRRDSFAPSCAAS